MSNGRKLKNSTIDSLLITSTSFLCLPLLLLSAFVIFYSISYIKRKIAIKVYNKIDYEGFNKGNYYGSKNETFSMHYKRQCQRSNIKYGEM